MKNVWILNHYAQEPGGSGGTRHFHLAQYLRLYGWKATIIAASVDHATGEQRLREHESQRVEAFQGVPFLWVYTPSYSGNGGGRMRNMLAYTLKVLQRTTTASLAKPDVVIGSSVHPFAAVAGAFLARRYKVPFVFEVRDLWPQTLIDMGRLREGSFIVWALRKLERWLYSKAARTVVLLPQAWKYIVPLGIPKERIVWIPNGVDMALYPLTGGHPDSTKHSFTLMYFGAHGQANGLDNLLQAMKLVRSIPGGEKIALRLIGDGPLKPMLLKQAQEWDLMNVQFEVPVPKTQIPILAAQADAFVIPIPDLPKLYQYGVSPNKLFDYLAGGRPILIASSAANNPVEDAKAGLTVSPDQPQALAQAMVHLASLSLRERQEMGRNGRVYVEQNHGFEQLADKLAATLDMVCAEHDARDRFA